MIARGDALLVVALVLGGSLWIESSHRMDAGAADDVGATSPASVCAVAVASRLAEIGHDDQPILLGAAEGDAALPNCD